MGSSSMKQKQAQADNLRKQGKAAMNEGLHEMNKQRQEGNRVLSSQRAQTGSSNVASSGSANQVEQDLATRLEQNIRDTAHQAMEKNKQLNYQADLSEWEGQVAKKQNKFRGHVQAVTGLMNISNAFYSEEDENNYKKLW